MAPNSDLGDVRERLGGIEANVKSMNLNFNELRADMKFLSSAIEEMKIDRARQRGGAAMFALIFTGASAAGGFLANWFAIMPKLGGH